MLKQQVAALSIRTAEKILRDEARRARPARAGGAVHRRGGRAAMRPRRPGRRALRPRAVPGRGAARQIFEALEELQRLLAMVHADPRLGTYFRSPLVPLERKRALLRDALAPGRCPPVASFVDLLLRKKRLGLFPAAVEQFEKQVRALAGAAGGGGGERGAAHRGRARGASRPGSSGRPGSPSRSRRRVDPELVGGLYVRIGDAVIDHSVKGLLASLQDRLFEVSLQTRSDVLTLIGVRIHVLPTRRSERRAGAGTRTLRGHDSRPRASAPCSRWATASRASGASRTPWPASCSSSRATSWAWC